MTGAAIHSCSDPCDEQNRTGGLEVSNSDLTQTVETAVSENRADPRKAWGPQLKEIGIFERGDTDNYLWLTKQSHATEHASREAL